MGGWAVIGWVFLERDSVLGIEGAATVEAWGDVFGEAEFWYLTPVFL